MNNVLQLEDIKPLIDKLSLIDAIESGFVLYSEGKTNVPPVGFLHFDNPPGDVHIKYGAVLDDDIYAVKIVSAFADNAKQDLPISDGLVLVFNQKTGKLKLVLQDRGWLTEMRTAAAGAVAAKHLAPKVVTQIGIVGTGIQARFQLEFLKEAIDCKRCLIWGRTPAKVEAMIAELEALPFIKGWGLELRAAESLTELTENCNLIVTTTSAKDPIITAGMIQDGTHITAMGSDDHGKQELDSGLLAKADIVVADSIAQCVDHGECHSAIRDNQLKKSDIVELGLVIKNSNLGRSNDKQITIVDLTGVAIQDIQIAKIIDKAFSERLSSEPCQ